MPDLMSEKEVENFDPEKILYALWDVLRARETFMEFGISFRGDEVDNYINWAIDDYTEKLNYYLVCRLVD
ncbi:hypothetical protein [Ruegeria sp. HKCCC2117]|uniref:hypothetical protein n=1 Tax=Ruegeria sp. HKCCC2117 TaxID=2682992 RepID=UPI0014877794|nr:hypothetical protein [Ruegeria sp. HKCCC2117]